LKETQVENPLWTVFDTFRATTRSADGWGL